MAELIKVDDSLNDGRKKLNEAIKDSNKAKQDASEALNTANTSINQSTSTQDQLDNIIIDSGTSDAEVIQARTDEKGATHATLKKRIDDSVSDITTQLAQTDKFRHFESMVSRKKPKRPMITIIDDDGYKGFYTVLFELAKKYNIPFTSAMITSKSMGFPGDNRPETGLYYSYDEIMEMKQSGLIEFVSHSHNHRKLSEMTLSEIRDDFYTTTNFMKKYGFNHRCFVIPFGNYGERELALIREFFDYSTGGIKERTIVKQPANNYLLGRDSADRPLSEIEQDMDEAVSENGWVILCSHVGQDSRDSREHYEGIIQSAINKGLRFVTLEEGLKHHGNIAQFGGTYRSPAVTVSSEGEVFGDVLGRVRYTERDEGINANTPITKFPKNTITFTDINTPNADGFPGNFPGILYTHRYTELPYARQTYIPSRRHKKFVRMWDDNANEWGEWVTDGTTQYLGLNAIKSSDSPNSLLLQRRISITQINNQGKSGFPNNEQGLLINYSLHSGTTYHFQEYKVFRDNSEYKRYWIDNSWSDWEPLSYYKRLPNNSINANAGINIFNLGTTTCMFDSQGNKAGLPNESSGVLTTYRESIEYPAFNYQEFKEYNTSNKYIRRCKSDGTWGAWRKYLWE